MTLSSVGSSLLPDDDDLELVEHDTPSVRAAQNRPPSEIDDDAHAEASDETYASLNNNHMQSERKFVCETCGKRFKKCVVLWLCALPSNVIYSLWPVL